MEIGRPKCVIITAESINESGVWTCVGDGATWDCGFVKSAKQFLTCTGECFTSLAHTTLQTLQTHFRVTVANCDFPFHSFISVNVDDKRSISSNPLKFCVHVGDPFPVTLIETYLLVHLNGRPSMPFAIVLHISFGLWSIRGKESVEVCFVSWSVLIRILTRYASDIFSGNSPMNAHRTEPTNAIPWNYFDFFFVVFYQSPLALPSLPRGAT